jgi:hypothetical protein
LQSIADEIDPILHAVKPHPGHDTAARQAGGIASVSLKCR